MARKPKTDSKDIQTGASETLAEMLYYFYNSSLRMELEQFRIQYEAVNGPTDLTVRYTSTWPESQQDWLIKNEIKRYFDGLPPFVKAFFRAKMEAVAKEGNLDDMPEHLLQLYASGGMKSKDVLGR